MNEIRETKSNQVTSCSPLSVVAKSPRYMENRIFLDRYRLSLGRNGLPIEMHRAPAARTYRGHEIDTGREVALTIVSPAPSDPLLLEKLGDRSDRRRKRSTTSTSPGFMISAGRMMN